MIAHWGTANQRSELLAPEQPRQGWGPGPMTYVGPEHHDIQPPEEIVIHVSPDHQSEEQGQSSGGGVGWGLLLLLAALGYRASK